MTGEWKHQSRKGHRGQMELRNDPRKEKATTEILAGELPAERSLDHHTLQKGAAGLVGKPSSRNAGGEESAIRCPSVEYGVH